MGSRARMLTSGLTALLLEPGCRMRNANERKALRSLPGNQVDWFVIGVYTLQKRQRAPGTRHPADAAQGTWLWLWRYMVFGFRVNGESGRSTLDILVWENLSRAAQSVIGRSFQKLYLNSGRDSTTCLPTCWQLYKLLKYIYIYLISGYFWTIFIPQET